MDAFDFTVTNVILIALFFILIIFACHCSDFYVCQWIRSNRKDQIDFKRTKLFHSSGYMIHSGSEFFLNRSADFEHFDKNNKGIQEKSKDSVEHKFTYLWELPQADCTIPPQPLRPAPAPQTPNNFFPHQTRNISFTELNELKTYTKNDRQTQYRPENMFSELCKNSTVDEIHEETHEKTSKEQRVSASTNFLPTVSKTEVPFPCEIIPESTNIRQPLDTAIKNSKANLGMLQHNRLQSHNRSTNPFRCECVEVTKAEIRPILDLRSNEHAPRTNMHSYLENRSFDNETRNEVHKYQSNISRESNPFLKEAISVHHSDRMPIVVQKEDDLLPETFHTPSQNNFPTTNMEEKNSMAGYETSINEKETSDLCNPNNKLSQLNYCSYKKKGSHMLKKTISEDFLLRNFRVCPENSYKTSICSLKRNWFFGNSFGLGRRNSTQSLLKTSTAFDVDGMNISHANSCDSVQQDSSTDIMNFNQAYTLITGYLRVGVQYAEKTKMDGFELSVTVFEAKGLIFPFTIDSMDTFVRIYLVPDQVGALETRVFRSSLTPYFNETFSFWLQNKDGRHSLWFHLYHNGDSHTLIGEAEMEIGEIERPVITWIPITDSRKRNAQWGELMFSLSYLPTAERLTIVVVKARNIKLSVKLNDYDLTHRDVRSIYVKVYLMNHDIKVQRKRTSTKRRDSSPVFNESLIFSVPPNSLTTVQLRLTVFGVIDDSTIVPIGNVIAGSCATGKGLRHWHQMLSSLRRPVAMWHVLKTATNQPIFTGGAEAVEAALQSSAALRSKRNSIY